MQPFRRRIDPGAGPRRQRAAEDVSRGEHRRRAHLQHRRSVQRIVGQRVNRPLETALAHHQNASRVGVIVGVGDHRPRMFRPRQDFGIFVEAAEHHRIAAIAQASRQRHVFLQDHETGLQPLEFLQQRIQGRTVAVKQHLLRHRRQGVRQPQLEPLLNVGQHVDRKHQHQKKHPHKLGEDDQQNHGRVFPGRVSPVAGGGQGLGRPFQAGPIVDGLTFQISRTEHVNERKNDDGGRHADQQRQQAPRRTLKPLRHGASLHTGRRIARLRSAGIGVGKFDILFLCNAQKSVTI